MKAQSAACSIGLESLHLICGFKERTRSCVVQRVPVSNIPCNIPEVVCFACNVIAQALPIFLDKMVHPITAIIISVTAVLFFGEIIPQALCSR